MNTFKVLYTSEQSINFHKNLLKLVKQGSKNIQEAPGVRLRLAIPTNYIIMSRETITIFVALLNRKLINARLEKRFCLVLIRTRLLVTVKIKLTFQNSFLPLKNIVIS